ncbi:hypothetical protein B7R21_07580 [Subtercola boreus]|uniref:Ribbon-helix-helix protein CopG domain-containing protein n=1 Tax=Subtercola boreus TaxID=120213 RepID=A0A3E0VX60_9MICO|nr:hypothetical protein [Subtercola boreus]RFA13913.1 hypothetical protein B7R21_07580 [Subtercola boreus]
MSTSEKDDDLRGEQLSAWAESLDGIPVDSVVIRGNGEDSGRALLEAALGSSEAVDRAIGRPNLSGLSGRGKSPVRQVRLPVALDRALVQRANVEHRKPSEIVREALVAYLGKAS